MGVHFDSGRVPGPRGFEQVFRTSHVLVDSRSLEGVFHWERLPFWMHTLINLQVERSPDGHVGERTDRSFAEEPYHSDLGFPKLPEGSSRTFVSKVGLG